MDRNQLIGAITPRGAASVAAVRLSAVVVDELARLTDRDRYLLDLLHDHSTLTTEQVATLAFGSAGRARIRLSTLHERGILDRFRHYQRPGSQSWRWTLGPVGAAIVAAGRDQPSPRPSAVRDATARLAASPTLPHLLARMGSSSRSPRTPAPATMAPGLPGGGTRPGAVRRAATWSAPTVTGYGTPAAGSCRSGWRWILAPRCSDASRAS